MFALLFVPAPLPGDEAQEPFRVEAGWALFTASSGLTPHRVGALVETDDGLVWAVAGTALTYFDGYEWKPVSSAQALAGPVGNLVAQGRRVCFTSDSHLYCGDLSGFTRVTQPPLGDASDLGNRAPRAGRPRRAGHGWPALQNPRARRR